MAEFWGCEGCGRVGVSARDLLSQGCEGKPERLVPADLARDLCEALRATPSAMWSQKDRNTKFDAIARYERKVGES